MATTYYSDCSTITTGCYLYDDSALQTPVISGKYSDGTNIYVVTGILGEVTSIIVGCATYSGNTYVTAGGTTAFNGGGTYNYVLYADSIANGYGVSPVNTSSSPLIAYVTIYGTLGPYYATGTIDYLESCKSNSFSQLGAEDDVVTGLFISGVAPATSGNQTNVASGGDVGSYTC